MRLKYVSLFMLCAFLPLLAFDFDEDQGFKPYDMNSVNNELQAPKEEVALLNRPKPFNTPRVFFDALKEKLGFTKSTKDSVAQVPSIPTPEGIHDEKEQRVDELKEKLEGGEATRIEPDNISSAQEQVDQKVDETNEVKSKPWCSKKMKVLGVGVVVVAFAYLVLSSR